MDRISGVLPQVGWSTSLVPAVQEAAPATIVEAVSKSSGSSGGLGANVNTQTGQSKITEVYTLAAHAKSNSVDPDAPAGPPPTFEVSPLEAAVAALIAPTDPTETARASVEDDTVPLHASTTGTVETETADMAVLEKPAVKAETAQPREEAVAQTGWTKLSSAPAAQGSGQSMDVLR